MHNTIQMCRNVTMPSPSETQDSPSAWAGFAPKLTTPRHLLQLKPKIHSCLTLHSSPYAHQSQRLAATTYSLVHCRTHFAACSPRTSSRDAFIPEKRRRFKLETMTNVRPETECIHCVHTAMEDRVQVDTWSEKHRNVGSVPHT